MYYIYLTTLTHGTYFGHEVKIQYNVFFPKMDNKYFQNNYINHLSILHLFEDYYFNILNAYICFHLFGGFYSLY